MKTSSLQSQIESLLFISPRPLQLKKLIELTGRTKMDILKALDDLMSSTNRDGRGISIVHHDNSYQMTTSGENSKLVEDIVKEELTGELTKPSLETLTIIAYRGPITKTDLELIRGVNCSLIVRNLLIRGLIEAKEDKKLVQTVYTVTIPFLLHLGLHSVKELPDYEILHSNENIEKLLQTGEKMKISTVT